MILYIKKPQKTVVFSISNNKPLDLQVDKFKCPLVRRRPFRDKSWCKRVVRKRELTLEWPFPNRTADERKKCLQSDVEVACFLQGRLFSLLV